LVPLARRLVEREIERGTRPGDACRSALTRIRGIELDRGLARLSGALLQAAIHQYAPVTVPREKVIRRDDALAVQYQHRVDLVIGNPPYGRVLGRLSAATLARSGEANIGGHTNLYSLFLLRALDWLKPGGGLVFVLPTSFAGGPYFSGLRKEILKRASVKRIDLHEQRENLFVGAVQDVCILTLERRPEALNPAEAESYDLGLVEDDGTRRVVGIAAVAGGGAPWELPINRRVVLLPLPSDEGASFTAKTFLDFGYEIRVGHVVPTRTREQLHVRQARGRLPVVWASAVRPDGSFCFDAAKDLKNPQWFEPDHRGFHVTRRPAVVLQRTSNRDQSRRLNAAAVPDDFRLEHTETGFVGENHVITFEAINDCPSLSPAALARLLNSSVLNERFSSLSGSFSVSAKLLKQMALPPLDQLPDKAEVATYETDLRRAFSRVENLLTSVPSPSDPMPEQIPLIESGTAIDRDPSGRASARGD
jgi:adenine-specific DNA-methyltransferase